MLVDFEVYNILFTMHIIDRMRYILGTGHCSYLGLCSAITNLFVHIFAFFHRTGCSHQRNIEIIHDWVDMIFVRLRLHTYLPASRIPTISIIDSVEGKCRGNSIENWCDQYYQVELRICMMLIKRLKMTNQIWGEAWLYYRQYIYRGY